MGQGPFMSEDSGMASLQQGEAIPEILGFFLTVQL